MRNDERSEEEDVPHARVQSEGWAEGIAIPLRWPLDRPKNRIKMERHAMYFGSYVKSTADEWSDIDLALVTDDFIGDSFDFRFMLTKLVRSIDPDMEPHPYLTSEFNERNPVASEIETAYLSGELRSQLHLLGTPPDVGNCLFPSQQ